MRRLLDIDFIRFCIVGVLGFAINFIMLTLLYRVLKFPIFIAQLISGEIALFSNFYFHHTWTYKSKSVNKSVRTLLIQFHLTSWFAIIATALIVTAGVDILQMHYIMSLFIAGMLALLWNFIWSKYVIWRYDNGSVNGESR